MARAKKTINENENNLEEGSAALETLHPGSNPVNDPKSRYEIIAQMIGSALTVQDDKWAKWSESVLAQIGKEGDGVPDGNAAHNAETIKMKEEVEAALKASIQEDLIKIFEGDTNLTEEFKTKSATLFEAAVTARVSLERVKLEEAYAVALEEEVAAHMEEIVEQLDAYLDYAAADWMVENEVAIESSLRNEIAEEFMEGIKKVFEENYLDIPESKTDVVDELASSVDELEMRLGETIAENAELKDILTGYARKDIVDELSEGMTVVEKAKLREISESIDEEDLEDFRGKLSILKESSFVKTSGKQVLMTEQINEVDEENNKSVEKTYSSPQMKSYVEAIRRTAAYK